MRKTFIICLAAAGLAAAGCNKAEAPGPDPEGRLVSVSVTADPFVTAPDTRLVSDNDGNFTWEEGDKIGVWTGTMLTEFELASGAGTSSATFTATLSGTEAVTESSYAVYPYGSITVSGTTININTGKGGFGTGPARFIPMFAKAGTGHTTGFAFKHLAAVAKVPIYNIPAACKWIYVETYGDAPFTILLDESHTASTEDDPPYIKGGNHRDGWNMTLPDHDGIIDHMDFYIPLYPGEYSSNVIFKIKPQAVANGWGNMNDVSIYGHNYFRNGSIKNISDLKRGNLVVFPDIVYPADVDGGISATIEGGKTWKEGMKLNLYNGSSADVFTLDAASIGQTTGAFSGTMTHKLNYAICSTGSTLSVSGSTLTITNSDTDYPTNYALYGKAESAPGVLANYPMNHLGATIHLTLSHIPAATNYVFIECGGRQFFYKKGSVDLSAANPVVSGVETSESLMIKLPEHNGEDIDQIVFDIPILAGNYETPPWGFKAECYDGPSWTTNKTSDKPVSYEIRTDGTISRGAIYDVNLTFTAL